MKILKSAAVAAVLALTLGAAAPADAAMMHRHRGMMSHHMMGRHMMHRPMMHHHMMRHHMMHRMHRHMMRPM